MFGIFRSNENKIGQQIGFALAQSLGMGFSISRNSLSNVFWIDDNGQFNPPHGFYDDPYIIGFIISFIGNNMLLWHPESRSYSEEKKGNLILAAIARLAGVAALRLEQNCRHHLDIDESGRPQPEYDLGKAVALEYTFLVFRSTRFLSKKTPELEKALNEKSEDSQALTYCRDTFGRYIAEKYAELFSRNEEILESVRSSGKSPSYETDKEILETVPSDEEKLKELSDRISKIRAEYERKL